MSKMLKKFKNTMNENLRKFWGSQKILFQTNTTKPLKLLDNLKNIFKDVENVRKSKNMMKFLKILEK